MTPPAIVARARQVGLDLIAIADHNSAGNVGAVKAAARGSGLEVLAGMEVETREGVHVLCLFDESGPLGALEQQVHAHLPLRENDPALFGPQPLLDEQGQVVGECTRLLLTAADLSLSQVCRAAADLGGLAIPSHVDRKAYGLLGVLGMLPADLELAALEISPRLTAQAACRQYPSLRGKVLLGGSDAHRLEQMGQPHTLFRLQAPTVGELRLALRGEQGRGCLGLEGGTA